MRVSRSFGLLFGIFLAALPDVARAETEARCDRGDCSYRFDDDGLGGPGWSAYGEYLKTHPPHARTLLIRPRVSFVPELLRTVAGL